MGRKGRTQGATTAAAARAVMSTHAHAPHASLPNCLGYGCSPLASCVLPERPATHPPFGSRSRAAAQSPGGWRRLGAGSRFWGACWSSPRPTAGRSRQVRGRGQGAQGRGKQVRGSQVKAAAAAAAHAPAPAVASAVPSGRPSAAAAHPIHHVTPPNHSATPTPPTSTHVATPVHTTPHNPQHTPSTHLDHHGVPLALHLVGAGVQQDWEAPDQLSAPLGLQGRSGGRRRGGVWGWGRGLRDGSGPVGERHGN